MLKQMRQKEFAKKVLWVVTIIIIISFGFLGTAYLFANGLGIHSAGKIFGHNVSLMEFDQAARDVRTQAILRYGDNFNQVQQFLDFDTETWDRLIMLQEAKRRHIKITDEEVVKEIESYPFFQRNGQFDTLLYNDILRYVLKVKPNEFEESIRDNLKFKKLLDSQTKDVAITDEDVLAEYEQQNAKVKISYILVNPQPFINQAAFDEAKGREYFEANKTAFLKPPSISADFISFPLPQPKTTAENTEPVIDEAATAAVRQQAQETLDKISAANGDMSKVAQEANLPVENTGYFSANEPNPALGWPFETLGKLFDANVGTIEGPVETAQSLYIIKLKEKRDGYVPTFEEARDQVREAMSKGAAKELAKAKAQEELKQIQSAIEANPSSEFSDVVKKIGLEMFQTPAFTRGQYLPKIGISKEFQDVAFALNTTNRLSDVVDTAAGYAVLYLDENVPVDLEQFEKDKQALKDSILANKKSEAFSEYLTRLRLEAKLKDNIAKYRQQTAPTQQ